MKLKIGESVVIKAATDEIDGMRVTGPLLKLYHDVERDDFIDKFGLSPTDMRNTIKTIVGHTPHSKGVKIELPRFKKAVDVAISKLPRDAKYLKRDKVKLSDKLEEEQQLAFLKYIQKLLEKEDGESFEGQPKFKHNLRMVDVTNSLHTIADILKSVDENLSKKVNGVAEQFSKIKGYNIDQDLVYKILKEVKINDITKEIATEFKKLDDSKHQIKYGRKIINLAQILTAYRQNFQDMLRDLVEQGLDINKIRG